MLMIHVEQCLKSGVRNFCATSCKKTFSENVSQTPNIGLASVFMSSLLK